MEVQTFFLCENLQKIGSGNVWDVKKVALNSFFSIDGTFPLQVVLQFYLLVRREQRKNDEIITFRFNLVDSDGKIKGTPKDIFVTGVFPDGHRFKHFYGEMSFSFPEKGDYRLDITADESKLMSIFSYGIEITDKP